MKIVIATIFFLTALPALHAQRLSTDSLKKVLVFKETLWDFKEVKEGDTAFHKFTFTNKGKDSVRILEVIRGCGCVYPSWTTKAIAVCDTGSVTIGFISAGQSGNFTKGFSLYTSIGYFPLTITGVVISKKEE